MIILATSLFIDISTTGLLYGLTIDNVKLVRLGKMLSKGIEDGAVPLLATNLAEGDTIDCNNGIRYRFNSYAYLNSNFANAAKPSNPFLNRYPNSLIAESWNSQWNDTIISIDCAASWGNNAAVYIGDDLMFYVANVAFEKADNYLLNGDFESMTMDLISSVSNGETKGRSNRNDYALSWFVSKAPANLTDLATSERFAQWRCTTNDYNCNLNFLLPKYMGSYGYVAVLMDESLMLRIAQTAITIIGQSYRLSFLLGCDSGNTTHSGGQLSVRIGSTTSSIYAGNFPVTGTVMKYKEISFTATSI